jgi:deoxyribodipyrimidine photo-lyase
MTASRRLSWNFALDRAIAWARELKRPLLVLEALRAGYPWATDRHHRFVLDGMAEHARRLARSPVGYFPYVEPAPDRGRGLLEALAARAAVVVTDDYPAFFLPRMLAAAGRRVRVRLEAVDANGLVPMRAAGRVFTTAHSFRASLQRELRTHLKDLPAADPLAGLRLPRAAPLPAAIAGRWPAATGALLAGDGAALARLPIDHDVAPAPVTGGSAAGRRALARFVADRLARYADGHAHPDDEGTSRLSPYLHFGHVGAHEVFSAVMTAGRWTTRRLATTSRGARQGWWGVSPGAEALLDQLVTWRELGFNMCAMRDDHDRYASLPEWARRTLERHQADERPNVYSRAELAAARTDDRVWNAAQRQLVEEGWFHNYLRMVWGKRILEWSRTPADALDTMIDLMNRYALDGRDPNTYSGIFWTLGRYDRPWGPERPIFGTVRYMSSENTVRKLRMKAYLARWGDDARRLPLA